MDPPTIQALHPTYKVDGLFVGRERIDENVILEALPQILHFKGDQGPDAKKCKTWSCWLCTNHGQNSDEQCAGCHNWKFCGYFNEDGSLKIS